MTSIHRKNKKVIRLMKNELVIRIMTEFLAFRQKIYSYQTDEDYVDKKAKCKKKCLVKSEIKSRIRKVV